MNGIDFSRLTPCGECCDGCAKKAEGLCKGCIETDGMCKEWEESGGCPIFGCARRHRAMFCGVCKEFPCGSLTEKIFWNEEIIPHLKGLAELYEAEKMAGESRV